VKQNTPQHTDKAYAKANFYVALNGYIETFSPLPTYMVGKSYADRSAESWLEIAEKLALQIGTGEGNPFAIIEQVKTLVKQKQFDQARSIVQQGVDDADSEIRQLVSELSR
jgi:hypothetical protein